MRTGTTIISTVHIVQQVEETLMFDNNLTDQAIFILVRLPNTQSLKILYGLLNWTVQIYDQGLLYKT